jgi:hypothetical protein
VDENVVADGFDGLTLSGQGYWVRERIYWTDGSSPDETHHHFMLTRDLDPCTLWTSDLATEPETTGDPVADCEAYRDLFLANSAANPVPVDQMVLEFDLWSASTDEDHIAVAPVPGSFPPLGDPATIDLAFAFSGSRVLMDWQAETAAALDCAAADPWANVPSQDLATTRYRAESGALTLWAAQGDVLPFALDDVVITNSGGANGPGGTLTGSGAFEACDVERAITPSGPVD